MDESHPTTRNLERWTGGLSVAAGGVHGSVTPEHFAEWWGYGLFFVFAGAAQVLAGLALLFRAINPVDSGPSWRTQQRVVLWVALAGNLAVITLYVVTRTWGIPWFGPEAGVVEDVAPIDVASKALEAATVVGLALLLRRLRDAPVSG